MHLPDKLVLPGNNFVDVINQKVINDTIIADIDLSPRVDPDLYLKNAYLPKAIFLLNGVPFFESDNEFGYAFYFRDGHDVFRSHYLSPQFRKTKLRGKVHRMEDKVFYDEAVKPLPVRIKANVRYGFCCPICGATDYYNSGFYFKKLSNYFYVEYEDESAGRFFCCANFHPIESKQFYKYAMIEYYVINSWNIFRVRPDGFLSQIPKSFLVRLGRNIYYLNRFLREQNAVLFEGYESTRSDEKYQEGHLYSHNINYGTLESLFGNHYIAEKGV